nr:PAS-domain containing protein [Vibrio sp. S9_S30]
MRSIRTKLLLSVVGTLLLTLSLASVFVYTTQQNQALIENIASETLEDINTALSLSESVAQVAAMAPYAADFARPFHVQNESQRLQEKIKDLKSVAGQLNNAKARDTLLKKVETLDTSIQALLANVTKELFTREDLLSLQFDLYPLMAHSQGKVFINAFTRNPMAVPHVLIEEMERFASEQALSNISSMLSELKAQQKNVSEVRRNNAYVLSSIRAQSDQMTVSVHEFVIALQQHLRSQQKQSERAIDRATMFISIIILLLLLSGVYLHRFNSVLTRDLKTVTEEMSSLAQGKTNIAVANIQRNDEIGELARTFEAFQTEAIEKVRVTEDLRVQKNLLEAIFDNIQDGLSVFDDQDKLVAWNQRYLTLFKLQPNEVMVGMPLDELQNLMARTPFRTRNLMQETLELQALNEERKGRSAVFERYFDDGRIIEFRSQPMPEGGFVTLYSDLFEKKAIEQQLQQAQKMEMLGQLTGGVAHDFNNLLASLMGNLQLLEMGPTLNESQEKYLSRALLVTEKGSQLVERLLAFSRKQQLYPEWVLVDDLVAGVLDISAYCVTPNITVNTDLTLGEQCIYVDPSQLENALLNLILNSSAAMPKGGELTLSTYKSSQSEHIFLEVIDTGEGMSKETMQRALEPFFTTKQTGEGSGLGLSMVYGFVTQSGGEIDIHSEPSQGTHVKLMLPIGQQPKWEDGQHKRSSHAISVKPNAAVLLVEDDIEVSSVIREQLALMQLEVSVVLSVKEALEHLKVKACELVISDVNLGSTEDGVQLRQILASTFPHLPVILMSGLPIESLIEHHHFNPEWRFIAKPFQYERLKAMINVV